MRWRSARVRVIATPAIHDRRRWRFGPEADPVGYVVRGSVSAYFAGDTDLFDAMADLQESLNLALLPVWGWGPERRSRPPRPRARRACGGDHQPGGRDPDPLGNVRAAAAPALVCGSRVAGEAVRRARPSLCAVGAGARARAGRADRGACVRLGSVTMGDRDQRARERPGAQAPGGISPQERHDLRQPQLGQTDQCLVGIALDVVRTR